MTKEEKISKIYEVISDKTLSFGCRFIIDGIEREVIEVYYTLLSREVGCHFVNSIDGEFQGDILKIPTKDLYGKKGVHDLYIEGDGSYKPFIDYWSKKVDKIIGHPVMIGTCIDWIENKCIKAEEQGPRGIIEELIELWKDKTQSIDGESEECIDFIFNLL